MKRRHLPLLAAVLGVTLAGCGDGIATDSKDASLFDDIKPSSPTVTASQLLPLKIGNRWQMIASIDGSTAFAEDYLVARKVTLDGAEGIEVEGRRNQKLWRHEVYQQTDAGLTLLAFGDHDKPLMRLTPPLPITGPNIVEGDALTWSGTIRIGEKLIPSRGFSRVSRTEILETRAGRYNTYRVDTILTIQAPGAAPTHFPSMRWMSPNIGYVRRAYVDNNKPAMANLDKMELR